MRALLVVRAALAEHEGHTDRAVADLEAALALLEDPASLDAVDHHIELARLLAPDHPLLASDHAAAAIAASPSPDLVHELLAILPGLAILP